MVVADVFSLELRGTMATGRVESGTVRAGDVVHLGSLGPSRGITVLAVQTVRETLQEAGPGQDVGLLLRGVRREELRRGDVLSR